MAIVLLFKHFILTIYNLKNLKILQPAFYWAKTKNIIIALNLVNIFLLI